MIDSPAQSPSVDVNDLNFDTCERLRHLEWLLTRLGIADNELILDAGGYPCYMARAFPHRKIVTADMYAKGHAPYVKASGAALPFSDGTFAVTVACDVLEHVPQQHRAAFLSELRRVSSKAVVVAGPYTTPGAAQAELAVRQFLPESSPAQLWLAEHAECGLPSLDESIETLTDTDTEVRVLPVGALTEWMLFFAAQAAGERNHRVAGAVADFIARFNRLHNAKASSSSTPAYRHAIVAARTSETRERLNLLLADQPVSINFTTHFNAPQVEAYVMSLGNLLQAAFRDEDINSLDSGPADGVTAEYISRLETMLSHRGMTPPPKDNPPPDANFPQRLRRAWQILRGRQL